jgi:hypothetical protein
MGFSFKDPRADLAGEYLTVKSAAEFSGYNQQYLRRLLRENVFSSKMIGQMWLIELDSLLDYFRIGEQSQDKRYGPQKFVG